MKVDQRHQEEILVHRVEIIKQVYKIHVGVFINKLLLLLLLLLLGISTKHKPHLSKNKLFGKLLHAKVRINIYITCVYMYMYIFLYRE